MITYTYTIEYKHGCQSDLNQFTRVIKVEEVNSMFCLTNIAGGVDYIPITNIVRVFGYPNPEKEPTGEDIAYSS